VVEKLCANYRAEYEQNVEGFTFSKSKKARAAASSPVEPLPPAQIPVATSESAENSSRAPSTRKKRSLPEEQPAEQPEPRTRRSTRLSGGAQAESPPAKLKKKAAVVSKPKARAPAKKTIEAVREDVAKATPQYAPKGAPNEVGAEILPPAKTPRVAELRAEETLAEAQGPTKIALPFADTPVIQRNKEMRKNSAQGHRRSSTGMRGRRASSLMDAGLSNGEWHFPRKVTVY
jgi:kinetochore protein Mis13/DSN1